jgi:hypothetical protein
MVHQQQKTSVPRSGGVPACGIAEGMAAVLGNLARLALGIQVPMILSHKDIIFGT